MAKQKKTADELYEEYLAELLKTVPEANRKAVEDVLRADATKEINRAAVSGRSEINRQLDALREEREAFAEFQKAEREKIAGWNDWYKGVQNESTKKELELKEAKDLLKKYQDQYGNDDLDDARRDMKSQGLTQEEIDRLIDERVKSVLGEKEAAAIGLSVALTDLQFLHHQTFGERLNTAELVKLATERGLPLDVAYQEFTGEKRAEVEKKKYDAAIAKAKEEGRREALSEHHLPVLPGPPEPHTMDILASGDFKSSSDRVNAAVESFREGMRTRQGS